MEEKTLREEIRRYDSQINDLCLSGLSDSPLVESLQKVRDRLASQLSELQQAKIVCKAIKNS